MGSNDQLINEEEDDRISSGSATPAKRSRQSSPARDQQDQQAPFAWPSNLEIFVDKIAAFQSSLERGRQALQELLDVPNKDAYFPGASPHPVIGLTTLSILCNHKTG
ncbi:hypothetical protein CPC08DRAFT_823489 [Agrocybe pediades]|nr:hypothetical protein CPC08DRAFT_823489 [Agrocybe pediades]